MLYKDAKIFSEIKGQKFISNDGHIGVPIQVFTLISHDAIEIIFYQDKTNYYWREVYDGHFVALDNGEYFRKQLYRNHYLFDKKLFRLLHEY